MIKTPYKNYLLVMLILIGATSYFDRFVFSLALEAIKQDLSLNDSQIGFMSGIAFAGFYAIAGIPIARWADRGNRVTILSLSVGLLGIMVSLCGMVINFAQLLIARAGVAVGEAGTVPAAQSLITEYFNRKERPRAMGIYFMCYPVSMIIGYIVGGWLIDFFGWRSTFLLLGIPGVLIALVAKLSLRESRLFKERKVVLDQPSVKQVFLFLWRQQTFRQILLSFCVVYFFVMGAMQWSAPFLMRIHSMDAVEAGMWLAFSWGIGGLLGGYLGGHWATRYAANKEKIQLRVMAVNIIVYGFISVFGYLTENSHIAVFCFFLSAFLVNLANGPIFSMIQSLVTDRMRSVTVALVFLFANFIGYGLGPWVVGIVSDLLHSQFGIDSLRYALALSCLGVVWVAAHYWKASNTIEDGINRIESEQASVEHNKGDACV
jgi:MFS family permease